MSVKIVLSFPIIFVEGVSRFILSVILYSPFGNSTLAIPELKAVLKYCVSSFLPFPKAPNCFTFTVSFLTESLATKPLFNSTYNPLSILIFVSFAIMSYLPAPPSFSV